MLEKTTLAWKVKMIERDIFTLVTIFCDVDDFCKEFEPEWRNILIENQDRNLIGGNKRSGRRTELSLSEAMTIVILFHKTGYTQENSKIGKTK